MTPETYKDLLIGLFGFIVIGSFYLIFKSGFKLKKRNRHKPLFSTPNKEEQRSDIGGNILVIGIFILFLIIFDYLSG